MDYQSRNLAKALTEAARQPGDRHDLVKPILEQVEAAARVSIDVPDLLLGRTALHHASSKFHVNVMEVLLQAKASVGATDKRGLTALHHAVLFDCTSLRPPQSPLEIPQPVGSWLQDHDLSELARPLMQRCGLTDQNSLQAVFMAGTLRPMLDEKLPKLRPFTRVKLLSALERRARDIHKHYVLAAGPPHEGHVAAGNDDAREEHLQNPGQLLCAASYAHLMEWPSEFANDPTTIIRGAVRSLLRAGADPRVPDRDGESVVGLCGRLGRQLLRQKLQAVSDRIEQRGIIIARPHPLVARAQWEREQAELSESERRQRTELALNQAQASSSDPLARAEDAEEESAAMTAKLVVEKALEDRKSMNNPGNDRPPAEVADYSKRPASKNTTTLSTMQVNSSQTLAPPSSASATLLRSRIQSRAASATQDTKSSGANVNTQTPAIPTTDFLVEPQNHNPEDATDAARTEDTKKLSIEEKRARFFAKRAMVSKREKWKVQRAQFKAQQVEQRKKCGVGEAQTDAAQRLVPAPTSKTRAISHATPIVDHPNNAIPSKSFIQQGGNFLLRMQQQQEERLRAQEKEKLEYHRKEEQRLRNAGAEDQGAQAVMGRDALAGMMAAQLAKMNSR